MHGATTAEAHGAFALQRVEHEDLYDKIYTALIVDWDLSRPEAQTEALAREWEDDVAPQATSLSQQQLLDGLFETVHFWLSAVGEQPSHATLKRHLLAGPAPGADDYAALLWKVLDLVAVNGIWRET